MADSKQPEHPVNPTDEKDFADLKDDGRRYAVVHQAVGTHQAGAVVSAKDLGRGADVGRLVRLGAVVPLSDEEAKAHAEASGGATAAERADARRADPRFATGGAAPAPAPARPEEGPVRDDKAKNPKPQGQ